MSPLKAESLLTEFLLEQGNFAGESPSEQLQLSQDALRNAKERGVKNPPLKKPGWVNPGQILQWIEDRSAQDPVIDYEKQRRAARFVNNARVPGNPLPPFLRVQDHVGAFRKKEPGAVSSAKTEKPEPKLTEKTPPSKTPQPPLQQQKEESEPVVMLEPEGLDEELLHSLDLNEDEADLEDAPENVPEKPETEDTAQETKSKDKPEALVEEEEEEEEKPVKKKVVPTAAQLLDFEEEEEEFDEDDGLSAEETDETDVVFGTGSITQASMIKFMHQYPDSVLKFLLRRNLDGRPLPGEYEKIYDQWQQRGLMRGRLKKHLLRMMEWEEIPDTPIHELVGEIRNRILDIRLEEG